MDTVSVRVIVVDDDALVRTGLTMLLDGARGISVVAQVSDGFVLDAWIPWQP